MTPDLLQIKKRVPTSSKSSRIGVGLTYFSFSNIIKTLFRQDMFDDFSQTIAHWIVPYCSGKTISKSSSSSGYPKTCSWTRERTIHLIMYPVYIEASDGLGNLDIFEFLKRVPWASRRTSSWNMGLFFIVGQILTIYFVKNPKPSLIEAVVWQAYRMRKRSLVQCIYIHIPTLV